MQILITKTLPSTNELTKVLKSEFSDKYSHELFGLGDKKSIIVRKSFFVGAQISVDEDTVSIDGIPPSVSASVISIASQLFANLFIVFANLPYKELEKDIAAFLSSRYN